MASRRAQPDWSQPLPEPIQLGRRQARTLEDVRTFLLSLPDKRAVKTGWQHAARVTMDAANGGDLERVATAIQFAKMTDPLN